MSSSYSSSQGSLLYSSPFNHKNSSSSSESYLSSQDSNNRFSSSCSSSGQSQADTVVIINSDNSDPEADIAKLRSTNAWGILYANNNELYMNIHLEGHEPFIVGRDPSCDYTICKNNFRSTNLCNLYSTFSKKHFQVYKVQDSSEMGYSVRLENLSINDTFVNGCNVARGCNVTLNNCDVIAIAYIENEVFTFVDVRVMVTEHNLLPVNFRKMYDLERVNLGSGATGVVRRGRIKNSEEFVAVKMIVKKESSDIVKDWAYEARLMQHLDNPSIVKVLDVFDSDKMLYIILEFMHGDLFNYIKTNGPIKEDIAKQKFLDLLEAISYLHSKNIIHRDLKPENILMTSKDINTCKLKITDFGLSRLVAEQSLMRTICGTPMYIAPEILNAHETGYTRAVDVWSLGCILYIMLSSTPPFTSQRIDITLENAIRTANFKFPSSLWDGISESAKALIAQMLTVSPTDRISVENARNCEWLANIVES